MKNMDVIKIEGIEFDACHGVLEKEKEQEQKFIVDIEVYLDLQSAGKSDDLDMTVNYVNIFEIVEDVILGENKNLIESLCLNITEKVLNYNDKILKVKTTLHKPQAPINKKFEDLAVVVERKKG